jgi:prepilin-type N-terminal cleavage/methylation domain-containing protein
MNVRTGAMVRLRTHLRREDGFSLAELMVAMMVMSIAAAIFLSVLSSVQRSAVRIDRLSRANDNARLAIEQLDREIRSGNVLYDPSAENPTYSSLPNGYTLRIYTQTNATSRTPSPGYMCVLWTIDSENQLVSRMWPPLHPEEATGWRIVAQGIVNRAVTTPVPAFALDPDENKGGRTVDIRLLVNPDLHSTPVQTVKIETSSTGRNTSYGFPQNVCSDTPT